MTSMTSPSFRRLASFAVRSEPGNERLALAQVAGAVAGEGLSPGRLERLKTAVAEAATRRPWYSTSRPWTTSTRRGSR